MYIDEYGKYKLVNQVDLMLSKIIEDSKNKFGDDVTVVNVK